jgi:hypothetical protein
VLECAVSRASNTPETESSTGEIGCLCVHDQHGIPQKRSTVGIIRPGLRSDGLLVPPISWLNANLGKLVVACENAHIRSFAGDGPPYHLQHGFMLLCCDHSSRNTSVTTSSLSGEAIGIWPSSFRFSALVAVGGGREFVWTKANILVIAHPQPVHCGSPPPSSGAVANSKRPMMCSRPSAHSLLEPAQSYAASPLDFLRHPRHRQL